MIDAVGRTVTFSLALTAVGCVVRGAPPEDKAHDARFGFLGGKSSAPDPDAVCGRWREVLSSVDRYATTHTSFPETDPDRSCFVPIAHAGRTALVGRTPPGCMVPSDDERQAMLTLAQHLEDERGEEREPLYPCSLTPAQRVAASNHNAGVLRQVAALPAAYPYSAILVPGFGNGMQADSSVAAWLPGEACHGISEGDRFRFGPMVERTRRAADAWQAGVAPLVIVTGGSLHSPMVEAFAMLYLLECDPGARAPFVLVEPCAEHTHTNLRNAARWLVAMQARTGYLVTDDAFQADYFQDWTALNMIGGSVDQRSLRDWGYLVGSWRQASTGIEAGFWFTPYRFWAEPRDGNGRGLGSLTCVMKDPP